MEGLIVFIWLIVLSVWGSACICAGKYACRLGRNFDGYLILALFMSPILAAFLLFMLGETNEHRKARIMEEERWRRSCDTEIQQDNQQPKGDIVDILG